MLEETRRRGASVFIYIIFVILIAVFVINFGPQSRGGPGGCNEAANSDTAITIAGEKVRMPTAFRAVYSYFKANGAREQDAKAYALDFLVRREILAQAAEKRGLVTTQEMAEREIMRGYMFIGGQRTALPSFVYEKSDDGPFFNYKQFEGFVQNLNVTRSVFVDQQQRELLAALQAETLRNAAVASRDEALAEFLYERNTATYDVVAFTPRAYRNAFVVTEEDVARYAATHAAEVEARYKADERLYKGVKPQVHVRQIFVAKAAAPAPAAGAAPAAPAADPGKAKLEAARTDIASGKRTFVAAAKELSSEATDKASGGEAGWQTKEFPTLPETALNDAVKKLKVGEVSEVITTDRGFYLVTVQEERQGDLTLDQVKLEIAAELARDGWSKEAARRAAIAALDAAQKSPIKKLNELYKPATTAPDTRDIQQLLNNPNLTEEQKQQILQQYLQSQGAKSGSLSYESANVPAEWADAQGESPAGGSAAAPTAETPAAAGAAPTATTTAAPVAPAAPAAGEADLMKPSSDQLPQMNAVPAPNVTRAGPTPRATRLPELGTSKAAAKAVFDELAINDLGKQIYQVDDSYVIVQLIDRQQPKMEDFDKDADQRLRGLRDRRGQELLEGWLKEQCEALAKANRIKPNPSLTHDTDEKGKPGPAFYRPCMSFR